MSTKEKSPLMEAQQQQHKDSKKTLEIKAISDKNKFLKNDKNDKNDTDKFPIGLFPKKIQDIILDYSRCLNFNIDYSSTAILTAVSSAIGTTYKAEIKRGWSEYPLVYSVLVGMPGINKSSPLKTFLKPLIEKDNEYYQNYIKDLSEYSQIIELSAKEKEELNMSGDIHPPIRKQLILTDATPEAILQANRYNPRGLCMYNDEFIGIFKNGNRYNSGDFVQKLLSGFNGTPINIDRKSGESFKIPNPFINICGTIQPDVLNDLINNTTNNGLIERLLFCYPEIKKPYLSEDELSYNTYTDYSSIINKLLQLDFTTDEYGVKQPTILKFTPEAKNRWLKWQRNVTDKSNSTESAFMKGLYSKFEIYSIRFSLILELLDYVCGISKTDFITEKSVGGAFDLVEYYLHHAVKINKDTERNILSSLSNDKVSLYKALPGEFTTKQGAVVAETFKINERTYQRFIKDTSLFNKLEYGRYKKMI